MIQDILKSAASSWLARLFGILAAALIAYIHGIKKKQTNFEIGLQALLRAEIVRSHEKYTERGYNTYNGLEAVNKVYD